MVSSDKFRKLALELPGTEEFPHFERRAFRISGKTIFATLHETDRKANINLSTDEQKIYSSYDKGCVYPVPNKFGQKGWTTFDLSLCPAELVSDALYVAYQLALKKKSKGKK